MLGMVYDLVYHINAKTPKKSGFSQLQRFIYIYICIKAPHRKDFLIKTKGILQKKKWALKLDFEEPKLQFFATLGVFNNEDLGF